MPFVKNIQFKNGLTLNLRSDRAEQDLSIAKEVILDDCYGLLQLVRLGFKPSVIFDVGGHIGSFVLLAKLLRPESFVLAFEPNIESFSLYQQNIEENNLQGIEVVNCAISYDRSRTYLLDGASSTGGSVLKDFSAATQLAAAPVANGEEHYSIIQSDVKQKTLEEVLFEHGLDAIDLLKLDCEGSEFDILENVSPSTIQKTGAVIGEYHGTEALAIIKNLLKVVCPHLNVIGLGFRRTHGPFWAVNSRWESYKFLAFRLLASIQTRTTRLLLRELETGYTFSK